MFNWIKKLLSPPIFDDYEKTRSALYLNTALWLTMFLFAGLELWQFSQYGPGIDVTKISLFAFIVTTIALQFILRIGYVKLASFLLLLISWIILVFQARSYAGLYDTAFIATVIVILLAGLLLNFRYSLIFTVLSAIAAWGLTYFQRAQMLKPFIDEPELVARDFTIILGLIGLISYLTTRNSQQAIERTRMDAIELAKNNMELQTLRATLEKRVEERTSESEARAAELAERTHQLELATLRTQKRAAQLQAISEVARVIAQVRKLNDLLPRIVKVISEQFDFYHTGIFLTDEANQYTILSAASSQGGKQMLSRKYRLKVGAPGIVGYVTEMGSARIATVTNDDDAKYLNNPDLPNTKSEMAVPLISGDKIIGALDIQSEQLNAFTQEDIDVIQTLADQVSIAIENARLFDSTQKSLSEAETIYRQYIRSEWANLASIENILGFRYTVAGATPLENLLEASEIKRVTQTGQIVAETDIQSGQATLAVPIKLRDEVIGVLNVRTSGKRNWTQDEVGLVQAVAERVAVSAENARLFDQTTSRAERESAVSEITSKIRSTNDPNEMIQIAINELKEILNLKNVRIVPYDNPQQGNETEG